MVLEESMLAFSSKPWLFQVSRDSKEPHTGVLYGIPDTPYEYWCIYDSELRTCDCFSKTAFLVENILHLFHVFC